MPCSFRLPSGHRPTSETFEQNPLFTAIPAIAHGHVAQAAFFTDVGPIGVAFQYSAIEKAFDLTEYHASVSGGIGTTASLTLSGHRVCWALDPTPGKGTPADAITLSDSAKNLHAVLTRYAGFVEPETAYQTTPRFTYQTTGCAPVSTALLQQLTSSPSQVSLSFAGGKGALQPGAISPVLESVPSLSCSANHWRSRSTRAPVGFARDATAYPESPNLVSEPGSRRWSRSDPNSQLGRGGQPGPLLS